MARHATMEERPDLLAGLDRCRDWLALRAQDAPENFGHLLRLVEAERAWVAGDFRTAVVTYDTALRDVESRQRPWHRALIAERAGAALFISLHFNSAFPSQDQTGFETFCLTPAGLPSTLTRDFGMPVVPPVSKT